MIALGIDTRCDQEGREHPWRIVVADARAPARRLEALMRLPDDVLYLSIPRHPLYGDLTLEGAHRDHVMTKLAIELKGQLVHVATDQMDGIAGQMLKDHGLVLTGVEVAYEDGMLDDPHSIGGDAGHQIANIAKTLRGTT